MDATNNNLYMYILVNTDYKMNKSQIAGVVSRVVGQLTESILRNYYEHRDESSIEAYNRYLRWKLQGHTKIILKATTNDIQLLLPEKECFIIIDQGKFQFPAFALTAGGFYPTSDQKDRFSHLKLL